jgi:methylphosphotriester-DNA--protein-cysteine methyltransferase
MRRMKRTQGPGHTLLQWGLIIGLVLGSAVLSLAKLYGDRTTRLYHSAECPEKAKIKKPQLRVYNSVAEADSRNYYPCPLCMSLAAEPTGTKEKKKLSVTVEREGGYEGDPVTLEYHYPWCSLWKAKDHARMRKFMLPEDAQAAGFTPCKECNPPTFFDRTKPRLPAELSLAGDEPQPVTPLSKTP